MKPAILIAAVTTCFFCTAGCSSQPRKEFTEKKLVIAARETAKISEIDLSITNNGCGRQWVVDKDRPGYERPYCDLVIQYRDSTYHAGSDFKPVQINNIEITLDRINPWGREEDSIPPGGCRLFIRKLPDLSK